MNQSGIGHPSIESSKRWSKERAWEWYNSQPWPCGFNYVPATAISYTEMWMDYNFDPVLIDSELVLAESIGFNSIRVVLPFIVWENAPEAFKQRFEKFLEICHRRGIRVMPCLFDDCAFGTITDPICGKQPDVLPGWYANGWTPSPGHSMVRNPRTWRQLEKYVKDILGTFKDDPRIWLWDLYNEPTNGEVGDIAIALMEKVFLWARQIDPSQPLTVGEWSENIQLNDTIRRLGDIVTFHDYDAPDMLEAHIEKIRIQGRPAICTEWLNRCSGSTVADCLPILQREGVGAVSWGLVNGRTQTHLNWGHRPGQPAPPAWQHDLFRPDHTPYDTNEIELFKAIIEQAAPERISRYAQQFIFHERVNGSNPLSGSPFLDGERP